MIRFKCYKNLSEAGVTAKEANLERYSSMRRSD